MRIAVDLMGSDSSPDLLFQGVLLAAEQFADAEFLVIATPFVVDELAEYLAESRKRDGFSRIEFLVVTQYITMEDAPLLAVRKKKDASLVRGIQLVKEGFADAFVSAGNTGALIASARMQLQLLPGITHPALLAVLPSEKGPLAVLDVGGLVSIRAEHLVQFAHMGASYQRCLQEMDKPRVGLLNIGSEAKKGTKEVRAAYQLLTQAAQKQNNFLFVGNIEGKEAFQGKVDVLITDGFSGNVFLKTAEGISSFLLNTLQQLFRDSNTAFPEDLFLRVKHQFAYEEYPGATICGVEGVVIKCHGYSTAKAIFHSIKGAMTLVNQDFLSKIKDRERIDE